VRVSSTRHLRQSPYCDRTRYSNSAYAVQPRWNFADSARSVPIAGEWLLQTIEPWHARVAHARATVPAPCPAPCPARSLLAQELAGQIVDEVQPVAGGADHGSVRGLGCVVGYGGQPMLHVHSGLRAFVNDRAGHRISMMMPAGVENYVSIRRCYRSVSSRGEPWARKSAGILGAKQLSGAAVAKMQPGARRAGHHRCVFMLAAALPVSAVLHLQIGQMKIRFIPPLSALPAMKP
jgi:hypothetical protein